MRGKWDEKEGVELTTCPCLSPETGCVGGGSMAEQEGWLLLGSRLSPVLRSGDMPLTGASARPGPEKHPAALC